MLLGIERDGYMMSAPDDFMAREKAEIAQVHAVVAVATSSPGRLITRFTGRSLAACESSTAMSPRCGWRFST
jgi:hypothetical protein